MMTDAKRRLARVQFITGSIRGLLKLAERDGFAMLEYLLEMALLESLDLESRLVQDSR